MMEIVEPSTNQISLEEAAHLAGVSTKTVRRAAVAGQLPRSYVLSERGPRLVFQRDDLDRWLARRHRKPYHASAAPSRTHREAVRPSWEEMRESVAAFQATLDASRRTIADLVARLQRPNSDAAQAQERLAKLNETLAAVSQRIEQQATVLPAEPEPAASAQVGGTPHG
jgi:predicted DNA-binding transcriptional regulator AlpA